MYLQCKPFLKVVAMSIRMVSYSLKDLCSLQYDWKIMNSSLLEIHSVNTLILNLLD